MTNHNHISCYLFTTVTSWYLIAIMVPFSAASQLWIRTIFFLLYYLTKKPSQLLGIFWFLILYFSLKNISMFGWDLWVHGRLIFRYGKTFLPLATSAKKRRQMKIHFLLTEQTIGYHFVRVETTGPKLIRVETTGSFTVVYPNF